MKSRVHTRLRSHLFLTLSIAPEEVRVRGFCVSAQLVKALPEMNENALRGTEIEVDTLLKTFAPCKELGVGEGKEEQSGL